MKETVTPVVGEVYLYKDLDTVEVIKCIRIDPGQLICNCILPVKRFNKGGTLIPYALAEEYWYKLEKV